MPHNLIKLSKEITSKDTENKPGTSLLIVVAYDPESRCVDHVVSIDSVKMNGRSFTDITEIMLDNFEDETMAMVQKLEWSEAYSEYRRDLREYEAEDCMGRTMDSLDSCIETLSKIQ